jgi:hypothetical protein
VAGETHGRLGLRRQRPIPTWRLVARLRKAIAPIRTVQVWVADITHIQVADAGSIWRPKSTFSAALWVGKLANTWRAVRQYATHDFGAVLVEWG